MKKKFPDGSEMIKESVFCSCGNTEHQLTFTHFTDNKAEVFCDIYLSNYFNFWLRLKYGIKYIFGYKSKYGAFDSIVIEKENLEVFEKIVSFLKEEE